MAHMHYKDKDIHSSLRNKSAAWKYFSIFLEKMGQQTMQPWLNALETQQTWHGWAS